MQRAEVEQIVQAALAAERKAIAQAIRASRPRPVPYLYSKTDQAVSAALTRLADRLDPPPPRERGGRVLLTMGPG
jgi:hypothetical protein